MLSYTVSSFYSRQKLQLVKMNIVPQSVGQHGFVMHFGISGVWKAFHGTCYYPVVPFENKGQHESCMSLEAGGGAQKAPTGSSGAVGGWSVAAASSELPQATAVLLALGAGGWRAPTSSWHPPADATGSVSGSQLWLGTAHRCCQQCQRWGWMVSVSGAFL